jgi:hypothetical protein
MSKHINVNPDHYKVAGRERPGRANIKAPKQPLRAEVPMKGRAVELREQGERKDSKKPGAVAPKVARRSAKG